MRSDALVAMEHLHRRAVIARPHFLDAMSVIGTELMCLSIST